MNLAPALVAFLLLALPQEVYSPAEFVRVSGNSLRSRFDAAVRKQAVFWLGQKKDPRVLDLFEQMLKK